MVEPITINVRHLSQDVRLPQEQVQASIDLLDAGFSVPFIARYRKEVTQNLSEESIQIIKDELHVARSLCERKQTILKTIDTAGKLTEELDKSIREAKSVKRLEDIYMPFKPRRKRLAETVTECGLEPLALEILDGMLPVEKVDERAAEFINEDKKVKSVADALLGAGQIIADMFSCKTGVILKVRELLYQYGTLITTKIPSIFDQKPTEHKQESSAEEPAWNSPTESIPKSASIETAPSVSNESVTETVESPSEGNVSNDNVAVEEFIAEENVAVETLPAGSGDSNNGEAVRAEEAKDDASEVSELFQQIQEVQAEQGLPTVRSQNTLRKKKRAEAKKKQNEIKRRQREHFERQFTDYFDFHSKLRGIQAYRILAFNRGEQHRILNVAITVDEAKILDTVKDICFSQDHPHADFLTGCLKDALHKAVLPTLVREIRNDMTEYAERHIILSFCTHLRKLLLERPLVLGFSPSKRVLVLVPDDKNKNSVRAVALDEFGNILNQQTVFIATQPERWHGAEQTLAAMIRRFGIAVIGIGHGGGSRLVEEFVAHLIETQFADSDLKFIALNKSGSLAYATGLVAKEELPYADYHVVRPAVFMGRRLQNPIKELVKVEPTHFGSVSIQDIRGKYLKHLLAEVIESCVNLVGADLNSATVSLLSFVSGLNPITARRICEYRREHGAFRTREDLKKVPGINESVYTQSAGFLRIVGGANPLDSTPIHPEHYELTTGIIEKLGFSVSALQHMEKKKTLAEKILAEKIDVLTEKFSSEANASSFTVRDILESLSKPNSDPRELQPALLFRKTSIKYGNLTVGTELAGTVCSVTNFGAFVDIGLHESGFVHIGQMSVGYIQDAHDVVAMGDVLRCWVLESDDKKKRVTLSLLPPGTEKMPHPARHADRDRRRENRPQSDRPSRDQQQNDRPQDNRPDQERSRPPRSEGERREHPHKPRESRPARDSNFRDSRGGGRRENRSFDRPPKTFVSAPIKKEFKPITDKMKEGKEPMRSFGDLAQLFGRVQFDSEEGKNREKGNDQ